MIDRMFAYLLILFVELFSYLIEIGQFAIERQKYHAINIDF